MNLQNNTLISFNDAHLKASELRKNGESIVFTNGCFDLLHKGHVDLLNKASSYGDILIVGINSDRSVKSIKGEKRPIEKEIIRANKLLKLACVDYVIIFKSKTPENLIKVKLSPFIKK